MKMRFKFRSSPLLKVGPILCLCIGLFFSAIAQQRRPIPRPDSIPSRLPRRDTLPGGTPSITPSPNMFSQFRTGVRAYRDVITSKAITQKGLFTVHKVDDKWYFELADSIFQRDILVVNRLSRAAAGLRSGFNGYAGDIIGNSVIRFEKGPSNRIFLRRISFDEISRDTSQSMYNAVTNSNIQPIIAAFDINAYTRDSSGCVFDVTNYLNSDNDVLNFAPNQKSQFQIGGMQSDKSYIQNVRSYPLNVEIKTVKTYSRGGGGGFATQQVFGSASQLYTMEINSSVVMLPAKPMMTRYADDRVGFFVRRFTDFDANPQGVKQAEIILRWRLEPKDQDIEKYKRGELVEPKKQIVYYIDPATPKKWVPYLIQGVNDWQVAFEKAGFKNAIVAKEAPSYQQDSTWSIEDARYSAIVYKPSDVENAEGPNVHDPRTGEILESHINWFHNVMQLLRNWYFIQAAPIDPRARTLQFSDSLMGQLIRFVSSHEVGHTLGLQHNFGASSTVPVEKLRDKAWVEANGHTPSIMDYARFNYVAQPEDSISPKGIYPRIGDYDKWAIEWGYRWYPDAKTPEGEIPIIRKMATERLANRRLYFGNQNQDDPHAQSEDLGDNAMKASFYGIKNLKRIIPNLMAWTYIPNEDYTNLGEMYNQVVAQFGRYMGHVLKNVAGIYENDKTVDQKGAVYDFVPKKTQQEAIAFLSENLFTTPTWLLDQQIAERTGVNLMSTLASRQDAVLNTLTSSATFSKLLRAEAMLGEKTYTLMDLASDLKKYIWSELYSHKPIDMYRRDLQKSYVDKIAALITPASGGPGQFSFVINFGPAFDSKKSDVISIMKGTLRSLKSDILANLPRVTDRMTRYHLEDVVDRINQALKTEK